MSDQFEDNPWPPEDQPQRDSKVYFRTWQGMPLRRDWNASPFEIEGGHPVASLKQEPGSTLEEMEIGNPVACFSGVPERVQPLHPFGGVRVHSVHPLPSSTEGGHQVASLPLVSPNTKETV